ncbi:MULTISPECIES: hypothetical protein [Hymenobacter]|nr:hypothetical protein [Hymenobacter sp. J193]MCR5890487.1 hypothetical protein [Hymenobacter sp. J193]MCR5890582.1 hypothetical protein [Hymenobacter sp. J193]
MLAKTGSTTHAPFGLLLADQTLAPAALRPLPISERPALFVGPHRG